MADRGRRWLRLAVSRQHTPGPANDRIGYRVRIDLVLALADPFA